MPETCNAHSSWLEKHNGLDWIYVRERVWVGGWVRACNRPFLKPKILFYATWPQFLLWVCEAKNTKYGTWMNTQINTCTYNLACTRTHHDSMSYMDWVLLEHTFSSKCIMLKRVCLHACLCMYICVYVCVYICMLNVRHHTKLHQSLSSTAGLWCYYGRGSSPSSKFQILERLKVDMHWKENSPCHSNIGVPQLMTNSGAIWSGLHFPIFQLLHCRYHHVFHVGLGEWTVVSGVACSQIHNLDIYLPADLPVHIVMGIVLNELGDDVIGAHHPGRDLLHSSGEAVKQLHGSSGWSQWMPCLMPFWSPIACVAACWGSAS